MEDFVIIEYSKCLRREKYRLKNNSNRSKQRFLRKELLGFNQEKCKHFSLLFEPLYSSGMGISVKNHIDMLIFHTAVCAGASQIALMADGKTLLRISRRPVADAPEWGLI